MVMSKSVAVAGIYRAHHMIGKCSVVNLEPIADWSSKGRGMLLQIVPYSVYLMVHSWGTRAEIGQVVKLGASRGTLVGHS